MMMISKTLHQSLVDTIKLSKASFLQIGKLLYSLRDDDNFRREIGDGIDTWDDYLAQPEIGLNRGEANRLIQIYQTFILELGYGEDYISDIPIKNLHYLLPIAKNGGDIEELANHAKVLSQKDFRELVHELKTDSPDRTYEYMIMRKCLETGNLNKVHGIDSEQIINKFNLNAT